MGITPGIPRGGVTIEQLNSSLAPYLTAAIAASTYLTQANAASTYFPRTGGAISGNVSVQDLVVGGVDGPRLNRSGATIRARSNDGLSDAPVQVGNITASGTIIAANSLRLTGSNPQIGPSTNDGLDNQILYLTGGGGFGPTTRGPHIGLHGLDVGTRPGNIELHAGQGGEVRIGGEQGGGHVVGITVASNGNINARNIDIRNGNNPMQLLVQNRWTSDTNRETGFIRWSGDVLQLGTEKGSLGGAARAVEILTDNIARITIPDASARATWQPNGIRILTASLTAGGISFNGSNPVSNQLIVSNDFSINSSTGVNANGGQTFTFSGAGANNTSGIQRTLNVVQPMIPTSGNGRICSIWLGSTVNQTGGANGITQGITVEPTLISAFDWRSYDTNVNSGFAYHSSGTAPSRLGGSLQIGGPTGPLLTNNGGFMRFMDSTGTSNIPIQIGSDLTLSRASSGVLAVGNTTNNALGSLNISSINASGAVTGQQFVTPSGIVFRDSFDSVDDWYVYSNTNERTLWVRDTRNSRMHAAFTPGVDANAALTEFRSRVNVDSSLFVASSITTPQATLTGVNIVLQINNTGNGDAIRVGNGTTAGRISFLRAGGGALSFVGYNDNLATGDFRIVSGGGAGTLRLAAGAASSNLMITNPGRVLIGTETDNGTTLLQVAGSILGNGNIGFANARVEQPLTQSMALRTFESSLSAWQEPWIGRATPTGPVIGFLGASPIGRQTLPAAASDPATTQALCNALRTLLINFGLAN